MEMLIVLSSDRCHSVKPGWFTLSITLSIGHQYQSSIINLPVNLTGLSAVGQGGSEFSVN
jgi:hypothetical protein